VGNKIYVIGGTADYSQPALNTVYVYDPATNVWETGPAMPSPRLLLASCVFNGEIYVLGGATATSEEAEVATLEKFSPVSNTWFSLPSMPTVRQGLVATPVNGKLYAIGGTHDFSGIHYILNKVEVFSPASSGATEHPHVNKLAFFPNPGKGNYFISIQTEHPGRLQAEIWDLKGNKVKTIDWGDLTTEDYILPLEIGRISAGIYVVKISLDARLIGNAQIVMD
jgi:hypothetical protein